MTGELVSSVMSFYFRDEVLPYYGGGTALARQLKGNDFMYWELMRRSCERGLQVFDYGRSKQGTGSYSFKKNWGFEPQPAVLRILPGEGRADAGYQPHEPEVPVVYQCLETVAAAGYPGDRSADRP